MIGSRPIITSPEAFKLGYEMPLVDRYNEVVDYMLNYRMTLINHDDEALGLMFVIETCYIVYINHTRNIFK